VNTTKHANKYDTRTTQNDSINSALSANNCEYLIENERALIQSRQKSIENRSSIIKLAVFLRFDCHVIATECESGSITSELKPPDSHLFGQTVPTKTN